jgi:hypothetical protein
MSKPTLDQVTELFDRIKRGVVTSEAIQALLNQSRWLDLTQRFRNVAVPIIDECRDKNHWDSHFANIVKGYMLINEHDKALQLSQDITAPHLDVKAACLLEVIRHTAGFMNVKNILDRYLWPVYEAAQGSTTMAEEKVYAAFVTATAIANRYEKAMELLNARPHHTMFSVEAFIGLAECFAQKEWTDKIRELEQKLTYRDTDTRFKLKVMIARTSKDPKDFELLYDEVIQDRSDERDVRCVALLEVLTLNPILQGRPELEMIDRIPMSKWHTVKKSCLSYRYCKVYQHNLEALHAAAGIQDVLLRAKAYIHIAQTTGFPENFDRATEAVKAVVGSSRIEALSLLALAAAKAARN